MRRSDIEIKLSVRGRKAVMTAIGLSVRDQYLFEPGYAEADKMSLISVRGFLKVKHVGTVTVDEVAKWMRQYGLAFAS